MQTQEPRCPKCGQNRVRKVTGIHSAGITKEPEQYRDSDGYPTSRNVTRQTGLSRRLEPPIEPNLLAYNSIRGCTLVTFFLGSFIGAIALTGRLLVFRDSAFIVRQELPVVLLLWVFTSIFYLWARLVGNKARREFHQDHGLWKKAHANWEKLYYCEVCDVIFIPGKNEVATPEETVNFVYKGL